MQKHTVYTLCIFVVYFKGIHKFKLQATLLTRLPIGREGPRQFKHTGFDPDITSGAHLKRLYEAPKCVKGLELKAMQVVYRWMDPNSGLMEISTAKCKGQLVGSTKLSSSYQIYYFLLKEVFYTSFLNHNYYLLHDSF